NGASLRPSSCWWASALSRLCKSSPSVGLPSSTCSKKPEAAARPLDDRSGRTPSQSPVALSCCVGRDGHRRTAPGVRGSTAREARLLFSAAYVVDPPQRFQTFTPCQSTSESHGL